MAAFKDYLPAMARVKCGLVRASRAHRDVIQTLCNSRHCWHTSAEAISIRTGTLRPAAAHCSPNLAGIGIGSWAEGNELLLQQRNRQALARSFTGAACPYLSHAMKPVTRPIACLAICSEDGERAAL